LPFSRNGDTHWEKQLEAIDFVWNGVPGTLQRLQDRYIGEDATFDISAFISWLLGCPLPASPSTLVSRFWVVNDGSFIRATSECNMPPLPMGLRRVLLPSTASETKLKHKVERALGIFKIKVFHYISAET